jgi:hypothetical protein
MTTRLGVPVRQLEGSILGWANDSLSLGLLSAEEYGRPWDNQEILDLGVEELETLELKRIDPTRTVLLAGGAGAMLGTALVALWNAATNTSGGTNDEPPDVILIPFFSFVH